MLVTLLGVRGSMPVDGPKSMYYGGNTTSFRIDAEGCLPIFVDGGSGLYAEGVRLAQQRSVIRGYVLLTHTHWDHVLAFPRFLPLYDPRSHITFHASTTERATFRELFEGQHHELCFSIPVRDLAATIEFEERQPNEQFRLDSAIVRTYQLNHPGVTLGYRVDCDGRSVCVITDTAPIDGNWLGEGMPSDAAVDPRRFESDFEDGMVRFLEEADLVLFDTHFTAEGIKGKRHWGHSTPDDAVSLCVRAGVKWLALHHHAPADSDDDVRAKLRHAQGLAGERLKVTAGREGDVLCP